MLRFSGSFLLVQIYVLGCLQASSQGFARVWSARSQTLPVAHWMHSPLHLRALTLQRTACWVALGHSRQSANACPELLEATTSCFHSEGLQAIQKIRCGPDQVLLLGAGLAVKCVEVELTIQLTSLPFPSCQHSCLLISRGTVGNLDFFLM